METQDTTVLERTYLVQRLRNPKYPSVKPFGGGYKNGGLSQETADEISKVAAFEYMGSAEFEFGAVGETLQYINANAANYFGNSIIINGTPVYMIYEMGTEKYVEQRVRELAEPGADRELKEYIGFDNTIYPLLNTARTEYSTCGWLELDNNFMFFTNIDMFVGMCKLFNITIV